MIEPFISAVPVLKKLEDSGFEAYFVGGSVRDYLLSSQIHDVDIATSATPEEVKRIFSTTVDIGIEHGTVLVIFQKESYEVTTFRAEADYQDYRRPKEVSFIRNLRDDLQRRDFTMNAIAMDRFGQIVDPFDGRRAIKEKIIQTVGQANDRFQEDALRMMRAVRFVSQLSFSIEGNTILALTRLVHLLEKIAVERKRAEFEKLLTGKNCKNALRIMLETNLYSYLPGLGDEKEQIERLLSFEFENFNKNEMWSLLLFCLDLEEKSIGSFLREWRLPGKEIKEIQHIFHFLTKRFEKEWDSFDLYLAHEETIKSVEALFQVINGIHDKDAIDKWISIYNQLPIKHRSEMKVTGSDLMDWFDQKGGPWLSERLSFIEHAIIVGHITNDKLYIKEWLKRCSQK
ncbi:MAG TPA: CCA tRNA nucleotidyltransferase [Neobacillus sp.]|jgi:tRNA nucleotidyltransferase (CCA-adding enzyme)